MENASLYFGFIVVGTVLGLAYLRLRTWWLSDDDDRPGPAFDPRITYHPGAQEADAGPRVRFLCEHCRREEVFLEADLDWTHAALARCHACGGPQEIRHL